MIETDGIHYAELVSALEQTREVVGATLEIGVRRGGSSHMIMEAMKGLAKPHIAIDPYGAIDYEDRVGVHKTDYSNKMRNETLASLFNYAAENDYDFIFFNLEDVEFFTRFKDGVPLYRGEKEMITNFSLAFVDGPHATKPVLAAFEYLKDKMSVGGQIVFDNYDHYPHDEEVEPTVLSFGYELVTAGADKKVYKRI
jgi:hypothetical protein